MRRFSMSSFAAGAVAATVLLAVPATAAVRAAQVDPNPGKVDGTAPSLTVNPEQFVVGASIDASASAVWDCGVKFWHDTVPMYVTWSGSDSVSGLMAYDIYSEAMYSEGSKTENTQQTSMGVTGSDYNDACGGGQASTSWWIVAKDNRGNSATSNKSTSDQVTVWQETGVTPQLWPASLPVVKSSGWSVSKCLCSDAGATMFSTAGGSSVTYTVTTGPGQTVGLVMGKNTNRGKANISVDGAPPVAVDTYASSPQNRVIVWQQTLGAGTHKVKVTNGGTPGRSRIDIDAVLLTRGQRIS